ncbi:MAG: N-6 DNA methylase [Acidobacteria bacterium]|nr:N-6 DNA methylase [Acidobacteriota bacterium]
MAGYGALLPSDFVRHELGRRFAGRLGERALPPARRRLDRLVQRARSALGPASSLRAVVEQSAVPLANWLGYGVDWPSWRFERLVATGVVRTRQGTRAGVLVVPWGASLDRAWPDAVKLGLGAGVRWCLCTNGLMLRLTDAERSYARRFVEFDLALAAADEASLAALWALARADALDDRRTVTRSRRAPEGGQPLVDQILDAAAQHAGGVCLALRRGVREAVARLQAAFTAGQRRGHRGPLDEPTAQALTLVYRVLFLLYAEARALVPGWHPIYRESYSLDGLCDRLARGEPMPGLWETLQAVSRLAHTGCRIGSLRVVGFNGRLFSPEHTPAGETSAVPETTVRDLLVALTTQRGVAGGHARRLVYRDLDVEELGAVYEHLLDDLPADGAGRSGHMPAAAPGSRLMRRSMPHASSPRDGRRHSARTATGSFYTPRSLTEFLVRRTLRPLVADRSPDEILALRVLDPAMGSGAFLVAACRYLAAAYEGALVDAGDCRPGDIGEVDRAGFRRLVAQRCLYGVDLNPMAVQLSRLSLWLVTLAADAPLSFLDHRLRVGNSLVGASPHDLRRQAPGARRGRRRGGPPPLFDEDLVSALGTVVPERERLALDPDDTLDRVRRKERALARLDDDAALGAWRRSADAWCAAWFWTSADRPGPRLFSHLVDACRGRDTGLPRAQLDGWLATAARIAGARRFFHWQLEFPEVFFTSDGIARDGAGFDAIVGNPPWDVVRADRGDTAERERSRRDTAALSAFLRGSGVFEHATEAHANQYQLFVERSLQLLRPGGRVGLVVPWGLAADHGSRHLRRRLFDRCDTDTLVAFDNRRAVFSIHRSLRFALVIATTGRPTRTMACRLGETDPSTLDTLPDSGSPASAFPVRLAPAFLRCVSGDGLAVPYVQTIRDVTLLDRVVSTVPRLGDASGWGVAFGRELNATEDRSHFTMDPAGLPVVEGKHLSPFRVDTSAIGRFIPLRAARRLLDAELTFGRARLAYRDVASSTNRLTLIAAVLPAGVVTVHSVFCLKTLLRESSQWVLCGLLNSFVANYLIRLRVTTHVSVAIIERLPVPKPHDTSDDFVRLETRARHLAAHPDDVSTHAELQAHVARLYGITPAEFGVVLDSMPLVERSLRTAALDAFEALDGVT